MPELHYTFIVLFKIFVSLCLHSVIQKSFAVFVLIVALTLFCYKAIAVTWHLSTRSAFAQFISLISTRSICSIIVRVTTSKDIATRIIIKNKQNQQIMIICSIWFPVLLFLPSIISLSFIKALFARMPSWYSSHPSQQCPNSKTLILTSEKKKCWQNEIQC